MPLTKPALMLVPLLLTMSACTPRPQAISAMPAQVVYPSLPQPPARLLQPVPKPSFLQAISPPAQKPM